MKKILLVLALLLLPSLAWGQCNGIFQPNTLCGNLGASPAPPAAFSASGTVVGPGSSTLNGLPLWANTLGTQLKDGAGGTVAGNYTWGGINNFTGTLEISGSPAVAGPGSSTNGDLASFNGTGGNTIQDSGILATSVVKGPGSSTSGDLACWNNSSGTLLKDCGGQVNSFNVSHTIAQSDCNSTVSVTNTFTNNTITLPAAGGFTAPCIIRVVNNSSSSPSGALLSGFPSGSVQSPACVCIYPNQNVIVALVSGAWVLIEPAQRWQVASLSLFVNPSGSDSLDGTTASTAFQHINTCINFIHTIVDNLNTNPTCNLSSGTFTEAISVTGNPGQLNDAIQLTGAGAGSTTLTAPSSSPVIFMRGYTGLILSGVTITCNGAAGLNVSEFAIADVLSTTFGTCTSQDMVHVQERGKVNIDAGVTVTGNASTFLNLDSGLASMGGVVTCSGSLTFSTAWVRVVNSAYLDATGNTYSGCGSVTATKFVIANAQINTAGAGVSLFPGGTAGTTNGSTGAGSAFGNLN